MKNILIKIIFLTALAGLIIYLDLTGFNQEINLEYYKHILSATGYMRPLIYIVICIIAPHVMFPFAVVIMTGGIVFGCVKGMILSLIGGFLSAIVAYCRANKMSYLMILNGPADKANMKCETIKYLKNNNGVNEEANFKLDENHIYIFKILTTIQPQMNADSVKYKQTRRCP